MNAGAQPRRARVRTCRIARLRHAELCLAEQKTDDNSALVAVDAPGRHGDGRNALGHGFIVSGGCWRAVRSRKDFDRSTGLVAINRVVGPHYCLVNRHLVSSHHERVEEIDC